LENLAKVRNLRKVFDFASTPFGVSDDACFCACE